jgi:hypothetical protein
MFLEVEDRVELSRAMNCPKGVSARGPIPAVLNAHPHSARVFDETDWKEPFPIYGIWHPWFVYETDEGSGETTCQSEDW